jgi:hypothetical protein
MIYYFEEENMRKSILLLLFIVSIAIFAVLMSASTLLGGKKWEDSSYDTQLSDINGYTSWMKVNLETLTGDVFGALGDAHAGAEGLREIYVNNLGRAVTLGSRSFPYPTGTIFVKETFMNEGGEKGMLGSLTIMIKRGSGYDPANNNWEYMMVSPDNEVMRQGKVEGCIGCHTVVADTDYVFNNKR